MVITKNNSKRIYDIYLLYLIKNVILKFKKKNSASIELRIRDQ